MIDYEHLKYKKHHYLDGDESLIENYDKALADTTQTWICHHRRELEPTRMTVEDLKEQGLYWNRPPEELIFLTSSDHAKLHYTGENNPMYNKSSWEKCTEEERKIRVQKYSNSMRGKNIGKRMWNNGVVNRFQVDCPGEGWTLGLLNKKTGLHWWNNGLINTTSENCPGEAWFPGRISKNNQ